MLVWGNIANDINMCHVEINVCHAVNFFVPLLRLFSQKVAFICINYYKRRCPLLSPDPQGFLSSFLMNVEDYINVPHGCELSQGKAQVVDCKNLYIPCLFSRIKQRQLSE
jgi:hypothetical protein